MKKRMFMLVLTFVMVIGLFPTIKTSAVDDRPEEVKNSYLVWDFENVPQNLDGWYSDLYVECGWNQPGQIGMSAGSWTLSVEEGVGYNGSKGLKAFLPVHEWGQTTYLNLKKDPTALTNWSAATELFFWVNASEVKGSESVRLDLILLNPDEHLKNQYPMNPGSPYQYWKNGKWNDGKVNDWGHILIPSGFVGWMRVPLGETIRTPSDMSQINRIAFYTEHNTKNASVYFDNFAIDQYSTATGPSMAEDIFTDAIINELKSTYFQPVATAGTILNGGTPKGLTVLSVDANTKYQVMKGFGASGVWVGPNADQWTEEQIAKMLLMVYDPEIGIGFTGYRHNIGGGSVGNLMAKAETLCIEVSPGVYDVNLDPVNMYLLRKAQEAGASAIGLIYYSPPVRMTVSGVTSGTTDGSTNLKAEYFDDYAEYVVGTALAIEAAGIDVAYVSPFNEPGLAGGGGASLDAPTQEHCVYTPDQVYQLTKMIANIMEREGIDSFGIAAAESHRWHLQDYTSNLLARFLQNETIMKHLDHFCAHSYADSAQQKEGVADIFLQHPEVALHQTEECRSNRSFLSYEFENTNTMAKLLHEDLTILNVSAWEFWSIADAENRDRVGNGNGVVEVTSTGEVAFPKRFFVAGQYSKFVTGHTRIGLDMPADDMLYGTAYLSPDGKTITLIINNYNTEPALISFQGLNGKMGKAYQTSRTLNLQYIGDIDATYGYEVPAMSVTTIVFEDSNATGAFGTPTTEQAKPSENPGEIPVGAQTVNVTLHTDAHSSVGPNVSKIVKGSNVTFTVHPDMGYAISSVTVNGKTVKPDKFGRFTLTNVTQDIAIQVTSTPSNLTTVYPLMDFENMETLVDLAGNGQFDYTNHWDSANFTIQAHTKTIQSGQSLALRYNTNQTPCMMAITLDDTNSFTNWGGAQALLAYVDCSMLKGQASFMMGFVAQNYVNGSPTGDFNLFNLRSNGTHANEFTYYIMGQNGQFQQTTQTRWGRCYLPEGYKGWIMIPMSAFVSEEGQSTNTLFNVIRVWAGFDTTTCSNGTSTPVFLDTIAVYLDPTAQNARSEGLPRKYLVLNSAGEQVELGSAATVDPEPGEPKPTDPQPTEPKPTEPQPTEPRPTEPQPTEPQPTETRPTEPQPSESLPTEPQHTDPKPTQTQSQEPSTGPIQPDDTQQPAETSVMVYVVIAALVIATAVAVFFLLRRKKAED